MATALQHPDEVEEALVAIDRDYLPIYGPHPEDWSKGVRGEYFERLQARRTADHEFHPAHPRRASAGRRRRHRTQLAYRIGQIAPGAVTVLVTPVWSDASGAMHIVYVARARDAAQQSIRLPQGGSHRIAALLQGAFPQADWQRAQTWHADGNRLDVWQQRESAAFRESADAGFVESLTAFDARLSAGEAR